MTTPVSFQCVVSNTTQFDIDFSFKNNFSSNFLSRASDYVVAITRMKVPVARIETFRVTDTSSYQLGIYASNSVTNSSQNFLSTIPNYLDSDLNNYYGSITYYSGADVLDIFSRTLYQAYMKMVKSYGSTYCTVLSPSTIVYDSASKPSGITTISQPFASNAIGKVAHIEVKILTFANYSTSWALNSAPTTVADGIINVVITAPSGKQLLFYEGTGSSINVSGNTTLVYCEGNYLQSSGFLTDSFSTKSIQNFLPPTESFYKLSGESAVGIWSITINSTNPIWGTLKYSVQLYTVPSGSPTTCPAFTLNNNKQITLSYEQAWINSGAELIMTPRLRYMLDFGNRSFIFDGTYYHFLYPAYLLNSTNVIVEVTQANPNLGALSNANRILVTSASLDVDGDVFSNLNQLSSVTTLCDFTIESASNESLADLYYSTDASIIPWRRYALKSTMPMRNIDFNIYVEYNDGTQAIAKIPPGSSGIIRASFFPK